MNDPKSGNAWAKTSTFYTDSNGEMKTPEKLPLGKYRIVEIEGPRGYFNDRQYNVVFELTSDRVYQVSGGSADGIELDLVSAGSAATVGSLSAAGASAVSTVSAGAS